MPNKVATIPLPKEGEVFLDALIGEGQDGSISVFLGPDELVTASRILHRSLGPTAGLVGQALVVSATVVDVREEHDRTSVTVDLSGAVSESLELPGKVPTHGSVNHLFVIRFTK